MLNCNFASQSLQVTNLNYSIRKNLIIYSNFNTFHTSDKNNKKMKYMKYITLFFNIKHIGSTSNNSSPS